MDKRTLSIFCVILGAFALVLSAFRFINGAGNLQNLVEVLLYSIGGTVLFFYGIHQLYEMRNNSVSRHIGSPERR